MLNSLKILFLIIISFTIINGCRTLNPEHNSDNPQPWAQPEDWERTKGIPGLSSSQPDY